MTIRRILPALLLALLAAPAARAQTAAVHGHALAADGAPIPLSMVRLVPAAGGRGRATLTDPRGAFRFDTVAAGSYRLQMERIGYTAAPSAEFRVADGSTSEQTLRAALRPVVLEAVSTGRPACYTGDRLDEAPAVKALWLEAQKAVELRRAFLRQYTFRYDQRVRGVAHIRLLRDRRVRRDTTLIAHPDSARALRERRARSGKKAGRSIIPDEGYLLADEFLATHCLEANPAQDADGMWALRFRPVRASGDSLDYAGTLRLDPRTFGVRRVEFEYMKGRQSWGAGVLEFADVSTPFGTVRLPRRASMQMDPRGGVAGLMLMEIEGTADIYNYRDFAPVGGV